MFHKLLQDPQNLSILVAITVFILLMIWYYASKPRFVVVKNEKTQKMEVSLTKSLKFGLSASLLAGLLMYFYFLVYPKTTPLSYGNKVRSGIMRMMGTGKCSSACSDGGELSSYSF